jgi:hypothetical protein
MHLIKEYTYHLSHGVFNTGTQVMQYCLFLLQILTMQRLYSKLFKFYRYCKKEELVIIYWWKCAQHPIYFHTQSLIRTIVNYRIAYISNFNVVFKTIKNYKFF